MLDAAASVGDPDADHTSALMLCDEFLSGGFTDKTLDAVSTTSKDKNDKKKRTVLPLRVRAVFCSCQLHLLAAISHVKPNSKREMSPRFFQLQR